MKTPDHHSNDCSYHIYDKVLVYMSLCWIWIFFFSYLVIKLLFFFLFPLQQFFKEYSSSHTLLKATPCWLTKGKRWIQNILFCQLIPSPGNNPGYATILLGYALYKTKQKGSSPETAFNLLLRWKSYTWRINKPADLFKIVTIITYLWPQDFLLSFLGVLTLSVNRVTFFQGETCRWKI